jgi:glycine cleavage system aminomethyltransferase T
VADQFELDGAAVPFVAGDSVAIAILRTGQQPCHGGTLCLAGDCPNCIAEVDGVAYVRTCQLPAGPGLVVRRHPADANQAPNPPVMHPDDVSSAVQVRRVQADLVVIGAGDSGTVAVGEAEAAGRSTLVLDARDGNEVVGIFGGPTVIVRTEAAMVHVHAHEVVVATGAADLLPVCPGNRLTDLFTSRAAQQALDAGIDLGYVVTVGEVPSTIPGTRAQGTLVRFEGTGRVDAVVTVDGDGVEHRHPCDTAVVGLGRSPRDLLLRMSGNLPVRAVGPAAERFALPPCPTAGTVCLCSKVEVADLDGVWRRGFHHLELVKRASLAGTGTCQGAVCGPYLRAFVTDRTGATPEPFTARPASRQITIAEAGVGSFPDPFRRTPLHDEHLALGANMDRFGNWWRPWNYGDHLREYDAVRNAVSIGDVSTLGKMVVSGPDVLELLERIYPTTIADIRPGRSRYVLLLNERGHLIDDGMVCRETDDRFVLTFTSGGAANAEMWLRDWIDTWDLDVRVLDRTTSLAAINVTGPRAGELLGALGLVDPPRFLQHRHDAVAGVPCHVMRLSFTGEASFELHHDIDRSVELWRALMAAGEPMGIVPHGLQALFGLRLEKGHVIVGQDTEMDTTPRRIAMDWAVKMGKPDFLGKEALARTAGLPDGRRLFAFTMPGAAPVEGSPIWHDGDIAGHVSSTFASPLLGHTVMLGWLKRGWDPLGAPIETVLVDGRTATVATAPFYDPEGARARL